MPSLAPQPLTTIVDGNLSLRAATVADAPDLLSMLAHPAVAEWWVDNTLETVIEELDGHYAIEVDGQLAGLLECHQEIEPSFPVVAFDIFLDAGLHGRGYGPRALRLAIDEFIRLGHHRFTIDPALDNAAARRAYASVGFQPVGVLRDVERSPTGAWRDGLLMDLLARDLTPR